MIQLTPAISSLSFKATKEAAEAVPSTGMTSNIYPQENYLITMNHMDVDESIEQVSANRNRSLDFDFELFLFLLD